MRRTVLLVSAVVAWFVGLLLDLYAGLLALAAVGPLTLGAVVPVAVVWRVVVGYSRRTGELAALVAGHSPEPLGGARHRRRWAGWRAWWRRWCADRAFRRARRRSAR